MIELYELRQFLAFAEAGTLSEAAETLHLSQPALSRNMKKLEEDLGVSLFLRGKNKLSLNETGEYVVDLVRQLLSDADGLTRKARDFDRRHRTLCFGVCAPAPSWYLTPLLSNLFPHMALQTEIEDDGKLLADLESGVYQLVVVHEKPEGDQFHWKACGTESLLFSLPKSHRFADRESLSFADMNGENMLLFSEIGFWGFIHGEMMPDSRFLTQTDRFSFSELIQASSLPCFTSDVVMRYSAPIPDRVSIPITDPEASVTYYLVCKAEKKRDFAPLFASL